MLGSKAKTIEALKEKVAAYETQAGSCRQRHRIRNDRAARHPARLCA